MSHPGQAVAIIQVGGGELKLSGPDAQVRTEVKMKAIRAIAEGSARRFLGEPVFSKITQEALTKQTKQQISIL